MELIFIDNNTFSRQVVSNFNVVAKNLDKIFDISTDYSKIVFPDSNDWCDVMHRPFSLFLKINDNCFEKFYNCIREIEALNIDFKDVREYYYYIYYEMHDEKQRELYRKYVYAFFGSFYNSNLNDRAEKMVITVFVSEKDENDVKQLFANSDYNFFEIKVFVQKEKQYYDLINNAYYEVKESYAGWGSVDDAASYYDCYLGAISSDK